jgi:fructose-1,6-bisphosphatase I/sedoheptulose-1,7-bisphosphatase
MAFLIEQAGGAASTGRQRMLDVIPSDLHQRISCIFGAAEEVSHIEQYHAEYNEPASTWPLYGTRGLFRVPVD